MSAVNDAYNELCCYTLGHGDPEFIHQHVVDAYAAQDATINDKPIRLAFALVGLFLHVERGFTGREVQLAHMKLARTKQKWPEFTIPEKRGLIDATIVFNVPIAERDAMIHEWCHSVWAAFSNQRDIVERLLAANGVTDAQSVRRQDRMRTDRMKFLAVFALALLGSTTLVSGHTQVSTGKWLPNIPKTWNEDALLSLEVPLAHAEVSPKYVSSDFYYRIPVRSIYRSYPVYHPGKEPAGYMNRLKSQEAEIIFDASQLATEKDWIRAGETVFDAAIEFVSSGQLFSGVRDSAWYEKNKVPVTKAGILPFMRYVIREKGKVELGILSCAMCHTRVMPDGSVIKGAQGNFPDDRLFAYETRMEAAQSKDKDKVLNDLRESMRRFYAAPWISNDPIGRLDRMTFEEIVGSLEAIIPGVCARQGSSAFYPPRIPDLIGLKDRPYLDTSGLVRHRSIGDLMRYAALNQGADELNSYGDFRPKGELPEPSTLSRYSDEQLYALGLYIYSLKPPPNPNKFDDEAEKGKRIFEREGCAACHTPPLYTNNKLTPVDGFTVPDEHRKKFDILQISVGTDPRLTLTTRRGTGYYKVPSLKGVWYRGPFEHNGSSATLEDWFDPRRLKDDYEPTGFRGYGVRARAVKGHEFGLDLKIDERNAIIKFLKTL